MSCLVFILGCFGTVGCIETDHNPVLAIIVSIVGALLIVADVKRRSREYTELDRSNRLRYLP